MAKQLLHLFVVSVMFAGLVSSCGGGDATLSRAEFIKRADAICERADKTQAGEAAAYAKAHINAIQGLSRKAAVEKLVGAILGPSVLKEANEIETLGAPDGDEGKIKAFIAAIEEGVKKAEKNPGTVEDLSGGPFNHADNLASEYGFQKCNEVS